ncbi:MAG: triose-phosphate isomerase, partial [Fimbriimonadaceae bacterium]|nr:triose-phosphate isomerase [Fimbriimonadaceae bacterium]
GRPGGRLTRSMARTKLIAGNWKMNLSSTEGAALVQSVVEHVEARPDVDVLICPPFLSIPRIREITRVSSMLLGAQNCFWEDKGAFTGLISPKMLSEFCVDYCIVGHSETRGRFGKLDIPESTVGLFAESDETVNLKIKALLYHGITPILCVGETKAERDAGRTDEVIQAQLAGGLAGVDPAEMYQFVIAYEPVWAIGTGDVCDTPEANRICAMIRTWLVEHKDEDAAENVRILYGGSVNAKNAGELFSQPAIDGGLVGGASLKSDDFSEIVRQA